MTSSHDVQLPGVVARWCTCAVQLRTHLPDLRLPHSGGSGDRKPARGHDMEDLSDKTEAMIMSYTPCTCGHELDGMRSDARQLGGRAAICQ